MDKRQASYKAIFTSVQHQNLLSLNAFSQAIANDKKCQLEHLAVISVRKIEESSCVGRALLFEKQVQSLNISILDQAIEVEQFHSIINTKNSKENNKITTPVSVHVAAIEESLQFAYKEEDSMSSSRNTTDYEYLRRIEESRIDFKWSSNWIDQPRLIPSSTTLNPLAKNRLINERKKIEEEKIKIQREKNELYRKKVQIETMLKEYDLLMSQSQSEESVNETTTNHNPSTITLQNRTVSSNPQNRSSEHTFMTLNIRDTYPFERHSSKHETKYKDHSQRQPQKIIRDLQPIHNPKEAIKQKKARQALLLQSLWINIIKHHSQVTFLREQLTIHSMKNLKRNWRMSKTVRAIESIVYSANFQEMCEAFFKIKKTSIQSKQKLTPIKKNIVIKFTKKENLQNIVKKIPSAVVAGVCKTKVSPIERLAELNYTQLGSGCINSLDFESLTMKSSSNRGAEIDLIIKNQLIRAKQQKALRYLSNDSILEFPDRFFVNNATCSGNITARVINRAMQQTSKTGCRIQMNVAVTIGNINMKQQNAYNNGGSKKITLRRK